MTRKLHAVVVAVTATLLGLAAAPLAVAAPSAYSVRSDFGDTLYEIDLGSGAATPIGPVGFGDVEALTFRSDGVLFGIADDTDQLITIDPTTGAGAAVGSLGVTISDPGLTFDDQGDLYMATDSPNGQLFRVNDATGQATAVGPENAHGVSGLAARHDDLYGLGADGADDLVRYDKLTGAFTVVGPLGAVSVGEGGIDFAGETLWGIDEDHDGSPIFTIDTATGTATVQHVVTESGVAIGGFESLAIRSPADPCAVTPAPAGCWHFDEPSGTTALDSSANANDGSYVNGPLLGVAGVFNTAVRLDGRDDHVRVPDHPTLDVGDSFTLEGWIKRDSDAKTHQLFNKGGQSFHLVVMDHFNDNQVWLRKANASTIVRTTGGAGVPADEQFHHVVATKTGSSVAIYIDGVAQTLQNVSLAQIIQNTAFPLFFSATASGNPIDGVIDEYAVYDEPLTADQVQQRFQRGGTSNVIVYTMQSSDGQSGTKGRRTANTRRSRASADRQAGACGDLGKPDAGVTGIRRGGMSCADAHQLIRGGDRAQRAAGMDCEIVDEDFSGRVVRITRECTGTSGRTLRYMTRS